MKVGHDPAVVERHARAAGVDHPRDADVDAVAPGVVGDEALGAALALVVAGAGPDRVDAPPVVLALGVDLGVAVDLAGRGLQQPRAVPPGDRQGVLGAEHAGECRADRIGLVVRRARGAGQVVDPVDSQVEGLDHVVLDEGEPRVRPHVGEPVTRLSSAITSRPSASRRSMRCAPRKPRRR